MELRKDPITRSWVVTGSVEALPQVAEDCALCLAELNGQRTLLELPPDGPEQIRVISHPHPLYRIEGQPERSAMGIYDRMQPVGAHEIVIEGRDHAKTLATMSDAVIGRVLEAYTTRIADLKRDPRFKYVTVLRNSGAAAGQEFEHPNSQIIATTFVPRRILYELRSAREWYREHERCVFCDILRQEEKAAKRIVDNQGDYIAFCPYASRIPYETWIMGRVHNYQFESPRPQADRRHLAALLGRTLRRLHQVAQSYHMVIHTAPNNLQKRGSLREYWKTIASDYHWHIEIMPILTERKKSYSLKETYFNDLLPETAAEHLRRLDARG